MSRPRAERVGFVLCALLSAACPKVVGRERVAYFERQGELPTVAYNYYPLKVAAAKGRVAVIDGAPNLGFKNSRVLLFDAKTGALEASVEIPRGTRRDAKASAITADALGRFYVAIEGEAETHLLRLTPPPPPPPKAADKKPGPASVAVARTKVLAELARLADAGAPGGSNPGAHPRPRPTEEWDAIRGGRYPTGLHASDAEQLWLVDSGNQRIIRIAWKGTDPAVIGSPRELDTPRGLAVTPEGVAFTKVVRGQKSRVLRYDAMGALAGGFDVDGLLDSLAWFHNDLRLDREGRLYVTDYAQRRILVFRQDGTPAGAINDPSFKGPMGIFLDDDDFLFVADAFGKQVLRFRPVYEKEAAARSAAAKKAGPAATVR